MNKIKYFFKNIGRYIKNVVVYSHVLWKDYDWDSSFMLSLEQQKLKQMVKWYEKHNMGHTVAGPRTCRDMKICVALLDIILEKDEWWTLDWDNVNIWQALGMDSDEKYTVKKYVNLKNWKRFLPNMSEETILSRPKLYSIHIREEKAWHLYNKFRNERLRDWWD